MTALVAWNIRDRPAPLSETDTLLWLYNMDKNSGEKIKSLTDLTGKDRSKQSITPFFNLIKLY